MTEAIFINIILYRVSGALGVSYIKTL